MSAELHFTESFTPPSLASVRERERAERKANRRAAGKRILGILGIGHSVRQTAEDLEMPTNPFEREKEAWIGSVAAGVEAGWLDQSALGRADRAKTITVNVVAPGSLTTPGAVGEVDADGNLSVAHGYEDALGHELNHAVLAGRTFYESSDRTIPYRRFIATWANEALTEHISDALEGHGDYDTLLATREAYVGERDLLGALLERFGDEDGPDRTMLAHGVTLRELILDYSSDSVDGTAAVESFKDTALLIDRAIDAVAAKYSLSDNRPLIQHLFSENLARLLRFHADRSIPAVVADYILPMFDTSPEKTVG